MTQPADRSIAVSDDEFAARLGAVRDDIAAFGRAEVEIVAVTKGFDQSAIECAQRHGLRAVGENYAQEVLEKAPALTSAQMHFIGRIQRNKVRKIVDHIALWQSVSRIEIVRELAARAERPRALLQVNPLDDPTKDGFAASDLADVLAEATELGVEVDGLMTIGVLGDPDATVRAFHELDDLAAQHDLQHRSMGMSGDYRDALAAGSTMLRLGSLLFGARPAR